MPEDTERPPASVRCRTSPPGPGPPETPRRRRRARRRQPRPRSSGPPRHGLSTTARWPWRISTPGPVHRPVPIRARAPTVPGWYRSLRPQRPARRAWTRSCGPPGQQTRETAVRRFCPAGTALRAVGGVLRSRLRCVRPPTTDPQMRQGPERSDPLGALSGVLPAQRTSSRSWEPVVRASASWWWCAASSSAGVTGATRSSKKKRLIRSRVFSPAVILPLAFGWAGSTW